MSAAKNTITAQVSITNNTYLRILFQQFNINGEPRRSWGGSPPDGKRMNEFLKITASQGKKHIPLHIEYDKMIWSGLSWGAAEAKPQDMDATNPVQIICSSSETDLLILKADIYQVEY